MDTGSTVSLIFLDVSDDPPSSAEDTILNNSALQPNGTMTPNSFIEYTAARQKVSLRTGCVCNPGGAAAILGIEDDMDRLVAGVTLKEFEQRVGRELGVVRISLGLVSSFEDVWRVIQFATSMGSEKTRQELWAEWEQSRLA